MEFTGKFDAIRRQRLQSMPTTTSRGIRRAFDVAAEDLGLNLTQAMLIAYGEQFGPSKQTQLADRTGIRHATTGVIIAATNERWLVRSDAKPNDGRVWHGNSTKQRKKLTASRRRRHETLHRVASPASPRAPPPTRAAARESAATALAVLGEQHSEKES
jgi:DNA-binding MarR family transcriptional regulator